MVWHTGPSAAAFPGLSFLEAVAKTDELGMAIIEASARQQVSPQVRKNLDVNLTAEELAGVQAALKAAMSRSEATAPTRSRPTAGSSPSPSRSARS